MHTISWPGAGRLRRSAADPPIRRTDPASPGGPRPPFWTPGRPRARGATGTLQGFRLPANVAGTCRSRHPSPIAATGNRAHHQRGAPQCSRGTHAPALCLGPFGLRWRHPWACADGKSMECPHAEHKNSAHRSTSLCNEHVAQGDGGMCSTAQFCGQERVPRQTLPSLARANGAHRPWPLLGARWVWHQRGMAPSKDGKQLVTRPMQPLMKLALGARCPNSWRCLPLDVFRAMCRIQWTKTVIRGRRMPWITSQGQLRWPIFLPRR